MKRILMILLAICAITSVQAQNAPRGEKRDKIITENLLSKMIPVNRKFAITRTPISYYLYWVVTGEKAHDANTSISQAAYISDAKQKKMVNTLNTESKGTVTFSIATPSQIQEARKHGLQGDIQHHGGGTHGFYLVLPYNQWQMFEGL